MFRRSVFVTIFIITILSNPIWTQTQTPPKTEPNKKLLGVHFGTGFFQNLNIKLTNFKQEVVATSDNMVPTDIKASFSYYFNPKFAIRFSSGYGFARQKFSGAVDYSSLDSINVKRKNKSNFLMAGFPAEVALIFQTAVDPDENFLIHIGIGGGYYSYNYRTDGDFKELNSETDKINWEEKYFNPEITLSGWAQFFTLGFSVNISQNFGATFEMSKVGLSFMRVQSDVTKQEVYGRRIINEYVYGYQQQDYKVKNGLDDVALTFGIFLIL